MGLRALLSALAAVTRLIIGGREYSERPGRRSEAALRSRSVAAIATSAAILSWGIPAASATTSVRGSSLVHRSMVRPLPSAPRLPRSPGRVPPGLSYSASVPRGHGPGSVGVPVSELVGRRSATSRVVRLSSGMLSLQEATSPINYRTLLGWAPIDNTIRPLGSRTGWYGTSDNSWTASFGRASQGLIVATSTGVVSITPVGASNPAVRVARAEPKVAGTAALESSGAVAAPGVASYGSVWPGVDVRLTVRNDSVSEDLVVNNAKAAASYEFTVAGADLKANRGGSISMTGQAGSFVVAPPRLTDAAGTDVTSVSSIRYSVGDGGVLVVSWDQGWMRALPESSFPLTVDPDYVNQSPYGVESVPSLGTWVSGNPIRVGTSGSTTWRAGLYFNLYESYIGSTDRVYDAQLQFPGLNYYGVTSGSPYLKVWDEYPSTWVPPTSYTQIGSGVPLVEGPWEGPNLEVGTDVDQWLTAGSKKQWFGVTPVSSAYSTYSVVMLVIDFYTPPAPSRVTNIAEGAVVSTTSPILQAAQISANPDDAGQYRMFDYQITTGPVPGTGLVVDSGRLCENDTGRQSYTCLPGAPTTTPPPWTVPAGVLSEGITYHAWVLTDWFGNSSKVPETVPPQSWGVVFTVKLGLGGGGPSPTDAVGSVPGQTSTPSQGAPTPGLPGSKVTVNMVNGNLSFSVGTPKLASVGGGLALGFTYNSLAATSQGLDQGLSGSYYNDVNGDEVQSDALVNGSDVQVAERIDPNVNFDWGSSAPAGAENPNESAVRWQGYLTLSPGTWALGDISSDGMNIQYNNSTVLSDWGPHAAQSIPKFGTPITVSSSNPVPVTIDWHHSSSSPAVAELFAEDLTSTPPTFVPVPATWLTHSPTVLPSGWTLNSNAAQSSWVGLADHGSSVAVYATDGTGYEFTNAGDGNYTPPSQDPNSRLHVDSAGNFVLDDSDARIYTFNSYGALTSVTSSADDRDPAALTYTYTGNPPELTSITDPVSGRSTTLIYGPSSSCPSATGFFPAPPELLCQINLWDGTIANPDTIGLYYNSAGELARVADPGGVVYQFGYDSSGQLNAEMDPLAYDAIAAGARSDCPSGGNDLACETQIIYDNSPGRAIKVISPAANQAGTVANGGQAERAYCYSDLAASISSGGTVTCSDPAPNVTSVAVAGLSPQAGYAEQVRYDARNRITQTRDAAGLITNYSWDAHDRLIYTTGPDVVESSTGYDSQGHPIAGYGPAPASSFQANGQPVSGQNVATSATTYDGGMSGLAAAWYENPNLLGSASYHSLSGLAESWPGQSSPIPGWTQTAGFSGHLTGLVTLPSAGRVSFDGDGGQVLVDGHPYLNQMGGPYPAQVRSDSPSDWWRLGEGTGATVAADSAGSNNGTYVAGVSVASTAPLADGDSTATSFNGTTGTVTVADASGLDFSNTTAFSVEAWVNTSASSGVIAAKMANASPYLGWELYLNGGAPELQLINTSPTNLIETESNTGVNDGHWHHLVVTYDGSSTAAGVSFYVDGAATTKTTVYDTLTATINNTVQFTIASRDQSNYFNGSLADVALYGGLALTAARVTAHYSAASETSAITAGPIVYNYAYPQAVEADSPTGGYWRLGDPTGSTAATDSWGNANGTYSNVTLAQPGGIPGDPDTSASFNGTSSYVTLPSGLMSRPGPYSVEAWFDTTSSGPLFGFQDAPPGQSSSGAQLTLYVGLDHKLHGGMFPAVSMASPTAVNDGRWHHAAISDDGAGNLVLYLDGVQVASEAGGGSSYFAYSQIGAARSGTLWPGTPSSAGWWYFTGNISDVAVYRQAITGVQVEAHYQAAALTPYPSAIQADTPVSLWRLADPPNSTAAADTFGPNGGSYVGGVTLAQPGPLSGDPATAAAFNGTTGTVTVPDSSGLDYSNTTAFSVEAWVKTSASSGVIAAKMANASPYLGWDLFLNGGAPELQLINTSPTNLIETESNTGVNDGHWHHLVVTYDGSSTAAGVTFYVDGAATAKTTVYDTLTASINNTVQFTIASRDQSNYFNGSLADVALYGTSLTANQVATHYLAGQTAPGATSNTHTITVDDQQFAPNGHLNVTTNVTGASFDPNYGLVTKTIDPDGKTTTTSYTDTTHGIAPQLGLPTAVTQDPTGLNLTTTTTYETPSTTTFLRPLAKTLPAGYGPSYSYYGNTAGPIAAVCGTTSTTNEAGALEQMTDPAPATGAGDARVEQYVYDATGRQVGIRVGTVNTIATAGWECTGYDAAGRITSQSYPAFGSAPARTVTYNYSIGGNPLINSVTDTNWGSAAISSTVDLLDRVTSYTDIYDNTTVTRYDQAGRAILTSGPQGALSDNYDPATARPTTTVSTPYIQAAQANSPISLWRLADPAGSTISTDALGTNPGTYTSGVGLGQPGPLSGDPATAAAFNGTTGTVTVPDSSSLDFSNTTAFSVEAWVNTSSSSGVIAGKMANASPYLGWELYLNGGEPELQLINTSPSNLIEANSTSTVNDGHWHHLVVTYDGSSTAAGVTFYVDGAATTKTTVYDTLNASINNTVQFTIASRDQSNYFNGSLADVALYGTSLTANQVAAHYLASSGTAILSTASYDSSGRLNGVSDNSPLTSSETLAYDSNGRPDGRTIYDAQGSTGETVSYSPAGRVIDQTVWNGSAMVDANPNGPNYAYDGAGRLTQAYLPGVTYNYSYGTTTGCPNNNAGTDTNRTTLSVTGNGAGTTNYCYDNADRLTSTNTINSGQIAYDGHGNTTTQGAETFAYDSSDQITMDDATGYLNLYKRDPLGRVAQTTAITKTTAGAVTTNTATLSSTISVNRPSGTQTSDALLVALSASSQGGLTLPTGWTLVANTQNGSGTTWVAWHLAASSDPSSWTFNVNSSTANTVATMIDYHNTAPAPIDVSATANDPSSTTQPLPNVTTSGYAETLLHVVGYNGAATGTAPSGDTQRAALSSALVAEVVSDRYQDQPGTSTSVSATSNLAFASEAITVALTPATSIDRLGYTGESDSSGFTQTTVGTTIGTTVGLPGGVIYNATPTGTVWLYTNNHGDVIETTDNTGNRTWTGYWGPYGENASGTTSPADTAIVGGSYGYNGGQGKLTEGNLVLMGARPYFPAEGRFTQPDPVEGGCANPYTYAFGDPLNNPDLSGRGGCGGKSAFEVGEDVFGLIAGGAAAIAGGAALLASAPEDALVFGIVAVVSGSASAAADLKNCVANNDDAACFGLVLGAAGVVAGAPGAAVQPAEDSALDAGLKALGGLSESLGVAAIVSDVVASVGEAACGVATAYSWLGGSGDPVAGVGY
jgi:RHS repeat-associated protein